MANYFSTGLQMGMGLARDVRSANLASAERKERSKYRKSAETRAASAEQRAVSREEREVSGEQRAVSESGARLKSLKKGMRRAKSAEGRAVSREEREVSAEDRAVDAAEMIRKINKQKLKNARNPAITTFNNYKGLLEEYQKNSRAAVQRFAGELAPVNKALAEAKMSFTASESVPNLVAIRDKMLADHKDFMHGLEQSFMAASNRPYEGKWSIRPYFNEFRNTMSYGAMFEGGSAAEAASAFESIKSMGGNVGISAGASAATPAPSVDPNDPLGIRRQTTTQTPPTGTFNPPQLGPAP